MNTSISANHVPVAVDDLRRATEHLLVFGTLLAGLVAGWLAAGVPGLFLALFLIDTWVLGYTHVGATFLRLAADRRPRREVRFFALWLPILCLLLAGSIVQVFDVAGLVTVYFFWQAFHYARQSWGISRVYAGSEASAFREPSWLLYLAFYSLPAWGVLYRSYQGAEEFIYMPIWLPSVPFWIVAVAATVSLVSLATLIIFRARAVMSGRPGAPRHAAYLITHGAIFAAGYLLMDDISHGWLALNVWHNTQYLIFVWMHGRRREERRAANGAEEGSYFFQPGRWPTYLVTCFAYTGLGYVVLSNLEPAFTWLGLASMLIIFQAINFHHYVVDGLIWKSPPKRGTA